MTLATTLLRFVDERLDQMLEAPEMWGADESVELQILQLLEIRFLITAQPRSQADWRQVQADYEHFLADHLPGSPPTTLTARLGAERRPELWSLLTAFVVASSIRYAPQSTATSRRSRRSIACSPLPARRGKPSASAATRTARGQSV